MINFQLDMIAQNTKYGNIDKTKNMTGTAPV